MPGRVRGYVCQKQNAESKEGRSKKMKKRRETKWAEVAGRLTPGQFETVADANEAKGLRWALRERGKIVAQRQQRDGKIRVYCVSPDAPPPEQINHGTVWAATAERLQVGEAEFVDEGQGYGLKWALKRRGKLCTFRRMEDGTLRVTVTAKA